MSHNHVYKRRQIETLGRDGYIKLACFRPFLLEMLSYLRPAHPQLKVVTRVGMDSIEQYIYLPRARQTLRALFLKDLRTCEKVKKFTRLALAKLDAQDEPKVERRSTKGTRVLNGSFRCPWLISGVHVAVAHTTGGRCVKTAGHSGHCVFEATT